MISFVNSALLTEESCYKFVLKYDNQNCKTKSLFSGKYNTHRNGNV